jgi:hypothetical protein
MSTHDEAAPAAGPARLGRLVRIALYNLPFAIALAAIHLLPELGRVLVAGAIVFLAPGLAWSDRRKGDAFVVLFRAMTASLAAALVAWLVLLPLPGPTSRIAFILILAAITNAGLFVGLRNGWYGANPFAAAPVRPLLVVAALFFAQSWLGAAYFVPALEDQDMETQGTAYGIIHEAAPTVPINRPTGVGGRLFFAHPLVLHFWIAETVFISGDLDRLAHHHESSLAVHEGLPALDAYAQALAQFERDPVLLPTRAPNLFLSAFIVLALGLLVFRLTGSTVAAAGACVIYATLPEVYVRSSYGGYMAVTNLLLTGGAYFYLQACRLFPDQAAEREASPAERPARGLGAAAAFLGGWADQKAVLLPLAAAGHAGLRLLLDAPFRKDLFRTLGAGKAVDAVRAVFARPDIRTGFIVGVAFLVGWASFALYGLGIAPEAFIADHLVGHVAERIALRGIDLFGYNWTYPSVTGLWIEFTNHSGWLLAPLAALAGVHALGKVREAHGLFLVWVVIGAVLFSLVDWRQTKHLAHLLPALSVLVAVWWASLEGRLRAVVGALVGASILWNLWRIGLLMNDFTTIQPTPLW